jgi:hypothetical protein
MRRETRLESASPSPEEASAMAHTARFALVLAAALAATAALAQSNPLARQAQPPHAEGFFRPTPDGDPSLTRYRPPPAPATATLQSSAMDARMSRGPDSNPASAALALEQARWNEEQLDRSLRESQRDRAAAAATPPPVAPGAYDGNTSARDR